eukprot:TRINITY_DN3185_c0_g1_i2.p1 TRINITY_DN3185_c0_g1~~TRINITY_DN3185_c0_g1_i2.p1  ORF type:complete len:173 (-),score=42.72 TRINITY_DN3185_c0_g1_i2:183-701(-)
MGITMGNTVATMNFTNVPKPGVPQYELPPEEYYEDDFEEYVSDEENDYEKTRLTSKAGENELKEVVDVYKNALSSILTNNLESHSEVFAVKDQKAQTQAAPVGDKVGKMKAELTMKLGGNTFIKVYNLLKTHRERGTDDNIIKGELLKIVDKKDLNNCFLVDQIIFLETLHN